MLIMAVGHSNDPDALEALREILDQCHEQLDGKTPQAGILFAAVDVEYQQLLDGIITVYPDLELVGCSTAGEISSVMGYQQDSIALNLFYSDEVSFLAGVGRNLSNNPKEATVNAYQTLKESCDFEPQLCFVFPEAVKGVYCGVVDAMASITPDIPVVGGVAGGDSSIEQTYQFFQNEVCSDAVPMLLMGGNLKISHGYASGWHPLGRTGQVTKVQGNTISEIDHKPAVSFYEHYTSTFSPDNTYPLAVYPPGEDNYLLRTSVDSETKNGQLIVGGNVPEHSTVRITSTKQEEIIDATKHSFTNALEKYPGQAPDAALFFSCAWRSWVLGTQTHQEFDVIRNAPNMALPCSGFYTFGEIAPLRHGGAPFSHNTTFVTVLIGTR